MVTEQTEKLYSRIPVTAEWINKTYHHNRILEIIVMSIVRSEIANGWLLSDQSIESISNPKDRVAVKEILERITDETSPLNRSNQPTTTRSSR